MERSSKPLILLTGRRAPSFKEILSEEFPQYDFNIIPREDLRYAVVEKAPIMAIICTSDIDTENIDLVTCKTDTLFLFILPEYTSKLHTLSSNPFFDFVIGDISSSELKFRIEKLNWLRRKLQEYKSIIADVKATKYNLIYEVSRIAEIKSGLDGGHIIRVAEYASLIARELGFKINEINSLFKASISHDIGKIVVPDFILQKNSRLEPQEKDMVKQHTIAGAEIIEKLFNAEHHSSPDQITELAREIALFHHESPDGSGYPYGLKHKEIPVSARIVKVADVYDALLTQRHYKPSWKKEDVIDYLSNSSHFDQECVSALKAANL